MNNLQRLAVALACLSAAALVAWGLGRPSQLSNLMFGREVLLTRRADYVIALLLFGFGLAVILGWKRKGPSS